MQEWDQRIEMDKMLSFIWEATDSTKQNINKFCPLLYRSSKLSLSVSRHSLGRINSLQFIIHMMKKLPL